MNDVLITAIVVVGTLSGIAMGNRQRNLCKHRFETIDYRIVDVYDINRSGDLPIRRVTHVSQGCEKCGEPKVLILKGVWDPERTYGNEGRS